MSITPKQARLARLFTAVVLGEWEEVRAQRRAAPGSEPDREWREAVLQTHLFAGFPRLVQAYGVLTREGGLGLATRKELEELAAEEARDRGAALFERIYGDAAEAVRDRLRSGHENFAQMIAEHAYGRVLSRPGLHPGTRELLAVCALAALGQDEQLASHARGALRCGASPEALDAVLKTTADLAGAARHERALRIVERFR